MSLSSVKPVCEFDIENADQLINISRGPDNTIAMIMSNHDRDNTILFWHFDNLVEEWEPEVHVEDYVFKHRKKIHKVYDLHWEKPAVHYYKKENNEYIGVGRLTRVRIDYDGKPKKYDYNKLPSGCGVLYDSCNCVIVQHESKILKYDKDYAIVAHYDLITKFELESKVIPLTDEKTICLWNKYEQIIVFVELQ